MHLIQKMKPNVVESLYTKNFSMILVTMVTSKLTSASLTFGSDPLLSNSETISSFELIIAW